MAHPLHIGLMLVRLFYYELLLALQQRQPVLQQLDLVFCLFPGLAQLQHFNAFRSQPAVRVGSLQIVLNSASGSFGSSSPHYLNQIMKSPQQYIQLKDLNDPEDWQFVVTVPT
jgi:hypothetical protein